MVLECFPAAGNVELLSVWKWYTGSSQHKMANGFHFKVFYAGTWNEVATRSKALVNQVAIAADHQGRNNDCKYYGMGQQWRY